MRLSRSLVPTLKETPAEAQIASHRLMLRAGLVRQTASGIYAWLPAGFRVLQNIARIVREEQDAAGAQEMLMPTIQSADLWRQSGRYDAYGPEMLRLKDRHERDLLYGPTNEEMITEIFRSSVKSYRELPQNLYHIQWKFRDEVRPRFGVMRGREFLMKDAYSFDLDYAGAVISYRQMMLAYMRTFQRLGLKAIPMAAESGPIGGDLSHEFIILAPTGESQVFYDRGFEDIDWVQSDYDYASAADLEAFFTRMTSLYAATDEKHDPQAWAGVPDDRRREGRGIEVGHIFYFGTKYSEPMGLAIAGADGKTVAPHMGSYGIGVSRLVGGIIEASHDEAGIIWPDSVAPWRAVILNLKPGDAACDGICEELYANFAGTALYDDRADRPGAKFADADLMGHPWQIIVGPRGAAAGKVELKRRAGGEREEVRRRRHWSVFGAFERAVAGRYLRARKGERFVSIIAIFSLIGIALGVATLIVVTSVMTGFQIALVSRVLGANGHISIQAYAGEKIDGYDQVLPRMRAVPGVVSVLPVLDGGAFMTAGPQGSGTGVLVRGVTQPDLRGLPAVADHIVAGSLDNFSGDDAVAVGVGIAGAYRLGIGGSITLIAPQGQATAFGVMPRIRAFKIAAIFDAGLSDYNTKVVFLPLPMAQIYFLKPDAITGFQIWVADPEHVERVLPALATILSGRHLLVQDWRHANDQIIGVLQVQKDTMFIVLGMIVLVAAFNVISSLIMLVKDKRADIAVLRTLGAGTGAILRIFLMCGAFVGITGTFIGTIIGIVFCHYIVTIQHWVEAISGGQVFDSSVFQLTALPNTVDWGGVVQVVALGLGLSLLATLYPSWRAARTDPVEALRGG